MKTLFLIIMKSLDCYSEIFQDRYPQNLSVEIINAELVHRNLPGIIFLVILLVIGVFGNVVVIIAYSAKFKRGTNYRFYVLFLAVLDTGNCVVGIPWCIVYLLHPVTFPSDILCRGGLFVTLTLGMTGSCSLSLIAFDRYRKICCPLKKQLNHKDAKHSAFAIVAAVLLASWFIPFLYENNQLHLSSSNETGYKCYLATNSIANRIAKGYYYILGFAFIMVSICLTVSYYFIMKKVKFHSKSFQLPKTSHSSCIGRRNSNIQTRKTTITFFIITTVFILTTMPHIITGLVFHFDEDLECTMNSTGHSIFYFFYWTIYINNVANPFIYGLSDERFRGILRRVFTFILLSPFKTVKNSLPFAVSSSDSVDEKNEVAISVVSEDYANKEAINVVSENCDQKSTETDID